MAEILTDRDLRHSIETIIGTAQAFIFIVSPYIDLDEDIKKAYYLDLKHQYLISQQ